MRAATCLFVVLAACAGGRSNIDAGVPPDGGVNLDAGATVDGGSGVDAGQPDAGPPPATIGSVPCPAAPTLLWTRTFADEVDFRGAADAEGNVYWVEYDPPPTFLNPDAPPWLVSANRDGENRYRVPIPTASMDGAFLLAGGKVVLSKGAILAAYDAATGTQSWTIDLSATYKSRYDVLTGITDLGNGKLAFAMYDYEKADGVYVADLATGAITWSSLGNGSTETSVQGSDGAGSVLASDAAHVFLFDASGRRAWDHPVSSPPELFAWPPGAPWLRFPFDNTQNRLAPAGDSVVVPWTWSPGVAGSDLAFAVSYQPAANDPVAVDVVQGGAVVAQGPIAGTTSYKGISARPFLAGNKGDHLVLLFQNTHSIPALCHPTAFDAAALARFDAASSYQCPLTWEGESAIQGAALLDGRVILGRRTFLTDACTHDLQPVTIEAYAVPGESLAPSGWVQRGGSPGLGMRPSP